MLFETSLKPCSLSLQHEWLCTEWQSQDLSHSPCNGISHMEGKTFKTTALRRLTLAVCGPKQWGVGVVRPPTQAMFKITHGVGRRRGGHCREMTKCRAPWAFAFISAETSSSHLPAASWPVVVTGTVVVSVSGGAVVVTAAGVLTSAETHKQSAQSVFRKMWKRQ